jgi:hypothetical protein
MTLESENSGRIRGSDVVEFDGVMASGGKIAFIR